MNQTEIGTFIAKERKSIQRKIIIFGQNIKA